MIFLLISTDVDTAVLPDGLHAGSGRQYDWEETFARGLELWDRLGIRVTYYVTHMSRQARPSDSKNTLARWLPWFLRARDRSHQLGVHVHNIDYHNRDEVKAACQAAFANFLIQIGTKPCWFRMGHLAVQPWTFALLKSIGYQADLSYCPTQVGRYYDHSRILDERMKYTAFTWDDLWVIPVSNDLVVGHRDHFLYLGYPLDRLLAIFDTYVAYAEQHPELPVCVQAFLHDWDMDSEREWNDMQEKLETLLDAARAHGASIITPDAAIKAARHVLAITAQEWTSP